MSTTGRCARCGTPLSGGAAGFCPACLLNLALEPSEAHETILSQTRHSDANAATELGPPTSAGSGRHADASAGVERRPGDHIGPYRLIKVLGEGGMGVVYLAEQEEPIRRTVALKLIKLGMDTRDVVARFDAERQTLALMDHPNIASVLDASATRDGRPYFVMEYVPGPPITEYCDAHRLGTAARLGLFITVCGAIQHAHQKGIIHRDLKPSNVLVAEQDGLPVTKVIDFGIAKATDQRLHERTMFTQHGLLVGTPEYMSPEQAELGAVDVDTRTDIYALGVVLYELLVGGLPFSPTRLREAGYTELLRIIREEEPARPSARLTSLGATATDIAARRNTKAPTLAQELRGDLDWITLKALEKDRARRYASASELAADLGRYLHHEPVVARPPSVGYRVGKFVRRNRLTVTAASLVVLAVISGLVVSSLLYVEKERQRREAVEQREQADAARRDAAAKAESEARQRQLAEAAVKAETLAHRDAQRSLETAETNLYFNNIDLADREIEASNIAHADALLAETPVRLRGWEWHYLSRAAHMEDVARRTAGRVRAMAFSTDESRITTVSQNLTIQEWDATTLRCLSTRTPLDAARIAEVTQVWLSPDARSLISEAEVVTPGSQGTAMTRSRDRSVWDLATGRRVLHFPGSFMSRGPLVFAADDHVLIVSRAFGSPRDQFEMWNIRTGQRERTLSEAADAVRLAEDMSLSPGGGSLALKGPDGIVLIDPSNGRTQHSLQGSDRATSPTFSADGALIAAAKNGVTIWRTADGGVQATLPIARAIIRLAFTPDGRRLAVATADNAVHLFDLETMRERQRLTGHTGTITALLFAHDASSLVTAGDDGFLRAWRQLPAVPTVVLDTRDQVVPPTMVRRAGAIFTFSIQKDGELAFQPFWWDSRTGTNLVAAWKTTWSMTRAPAVSADGRVLAFPADRRVEVMDPATGHPITTLEGPVSLLGLAAVELSPRGNRLAEVGGSEGIVASGDWYVDTSRLVVWDVATRRLLMNRQFPGERLWTPTFSFNGRLVAVSVEGPGRIVVKVFNTDTGLLHLEIPAIANLPFRPVFSPDGTHLAVITSSSAVVMADLVARRVRSLLPEQAAGLITSMAFSPDHSRLVTTVGGVIKMWETQTGRQVAILRESAGRVTGEWTLAGAGSGVSGPSTFSTQTVDFDDDGRSIVVTVFERHQQGALLRTTVWNGSPRAGG